MGIDYYGVLRIPRTSNDLEIKKAYRDLALEFNPEKLNQEHATHVFNIICEAYDVLANPLHRAVFDQYGEEGLKRGVPGPDGFIDGYHYHGEPMRTYKDFFGTATPYANLLDYLHNPPLECMAKHGRLFMKKQEPITHPLYLTLHESFFGGVKKMKIHRLVFVNDTRTKTEVREKILTIPIKPGIRRGTEIVFPEEGDQNPNQIPADVVFVTEDRAHETFVREGDHLVMVCNINLEEALLGTTITVRTIDHRIVRVPITDVVMPGYEKIVENEGMPILEDYPSRSNLIIRFNINFPKYLPKACKEVFHKGFQLAKIGGGIDQYETINKLVLADKILRVDQNEQLPPTQN